MRSDCRGGGLASGQFSCLRKVEFKTNSDKIFRRNQHLPIQRSASPSSASSPPSGVGDWLQAPERTRLYASYATPQAPYEDPSDEGTETAALKPVDKVEAYW